MEGELICRHCGRPIAVPASKCPWCNRPIMVICSACKQYTDDQKPLCQQCGAPLVADTMEDVRALVGLDENVAQIVADRGRARLVASGMVARYTAGFFFADAQRRTVLAELFGSPPDEQRVAAGLLFSAIAYLVEQEHCSLQPPDDGEGLKWLEAQPWSGQVRCLEGSLARYAGLQMSIRQAVDQTVAEQMGFRFEKVKPSPLRAPGTPSQPIVRDLSTHSATVAVIELARQTELPEHQQAPACRDTYQLLLSFTQANPGRARYLAREIVEVLDWFRRYEENPALALLR